MKNNRNPHITKKKQVPKFGTCFFLYPFKTNSLSSIKTKFSYCFCDAKVLITLHCIFDINQKEFFQKQRNLILTKYPNEPGLMSLASSTDKRQYVREEPF